VELAKRLFQASDPRIEWENIGVSEQHDWLAVAAEAERWVSEQDIAMSRLRQLTERPRLMNSEESEVKREEY
jgi:hypothetical protein